MSQLPPSHSHTSVAQTALGKTRLLLALLISQASNSQHTDREGRAGRQPRDTLSRLQKPYSLSPGGFWQGGEITLRLEMFIREL